MTGPKNTGPLPDSGRPKRAPPTIDLEATEVSTRPEKRRRRGACARAAPRASARGGLGREQPDRQPRPSAADLALDRRAALRRGRCRAGDRRRLDAGLARDASRAAPPAAAQCRRDRRSHRAHRRRSNPRPASRRAADPAAAARIGGAGEIARRAARRTRRRRARRPKSSPPPSTTSSQRRADDAAPAPDLSAINERIAADRSAARRRARRSHSKAARSPTARRRRQTCR